MTNDNWDWQNMTNPAAWWTEGNRIRCGKCSTVRDISLDNCPVCELRRSMLDKYVRTVTDPKPFWKGYRAWLKEMRANDRKEVVQFISTLEGIKHE